MSTGDDSAKPADESILSAQSAAVGPDASPSVSESSDPPPPSNQEQTASVETSSSSGVSRQSQVGSGPLAKLWRGAAGPLAARGLGIAKPASPTVDPSALSAGSTATQERPKPKKKKQAPRPRLGGESSGDSSKSSSTTSVPRFDDAPSVRGGKIAVPNIRQSLPDDIQAELDAELAAADVEAMFTGPAGMPVRKEPLTEGARVHGQVLKIHDDNVFVALGGPDEGIVALRAIQTGADHWIGGRSHRPGCQS